MADKLSDAHRSLIRAQEAAKKRLEEIDKERHEIKASLRSLDAALKALGKSSRRQARGSDGRKSNGPTGGMNIGDA